MESNTRLCSKCCSMRAIDDFLKTKQGKLNKICNRHTKKRDLPSFDQWDDFTNQLSNWSRPLKKDVLDMTYLFDLDQLPVAFGPQLEISYDVVLDRTVLTKAINQLVKIIQ